jgi:hypothetical protein
MIAARALATDTSLSLADPPTGFPVGGIAFRRKVIILGESRGGPGG